MTALDELEEIKELVNENKRFKYKNIVNFNCESIEKSLKALEIMFKKKVDVDFLKSADTFNEYNKLIRFKSLFATPLTEEEFNLLKEVAE